MNKKELDFALGQTKPIDYLRAVHGKKCVKCKFAEVIGATGKDTVIVEAFCEFVKRAGSPPKPK